MAFAHCTALTRVNWNAIHCRDFANNSSGKFYPPFYNTSVSEFTWGDKVEHIPAYSCYGMDKLTQVTLPEGVSLAKMTVLPTTPPAVTGNTFDGVTRDIPVLVPAASLTAYKAAEVWKEFIKLQAIGTTGLHVPFLPENIRMEGGLLHNPQQLHVSLYDIQGRQVYSGTAATISQPAGVYVLRCNGASGKAVF